LIRKKNKRERKNQATPFPKSPQKKVPKKMFEGPKRRLKKKIPPNWENSSPKGGTGEN